jgi:4-nitrophenyl phosphatase
LAPLIESYKGFIIDLDGVVYLLHEPIPGSSDAIRRMQELGLDFLFLTNNSIATPEEFADRLAGFDIHVGPDRILTSSEAAGYYLDRNYETRGKRALVIGEHGLLVELEKRGLEIVSPEDCSRIDFVFVGWDRHFDFQKLKAAVIAIRAGATYIAMNTDATYPTPNGLWPGGGTMVAAVSTGAGKDPYVIGKPNAFIIEIALDRLGVDKADALLVGDRLDSDIQAGISAGVDTLMVLTGISSEAEIEKTGLRPTHVRKDLSGLFD